MLVSPIEVSRECQVRGLLNNVYDMNAIEGIKRGKGSENYQHEEDRKRLIFDEEITRLEGKRLQGSIH